MEKTEQKMISMKNQRIGDFYSNSNVLVIYSVDGRHKHVAAPMLVLPDLIKKICC